MQKLTQQMNTISARSRFAKLFRNAQPDIELLTELYQATLFADTNIQKQHIRQAVHTWKRLRLRLLLARLSAFLDRVILSRRRRISTTEYETLRSLKSAPSE
jgi:hypothetical protein